MNTDKIRQLADYIETRSAPGLGFDMSYWSPDESAKFDCGTAACIAGWACSMEGITDYEKWNDITAEEILGIHEEDANELFTPWLHDFGLSLRARLRRVTPTA